VAPFRQGRFSLDIGRHKDLRLVGFEQKFPTGLARAEPPHLDAVALGSSGLVAIESKCTEYLSPKVPKFSERYKTDIQDERRSGSWFGEMLRLQAADEHTYRFLDVAQLIKHAFGLAKAKSKSPTLVYLYWEPLDASLSPLFAAHRDEVKHFAERIAGGIPSFESITYAELWEAWAATDNDGLLSHVQSLRCRYEVPVWGIEGVSYPACGRVG
jgi:hypothetical protein